MVTTRAVVNRKSVIENLEFADYDSLEDSCRDYARLITNGAPYHEAWEQYKNDRNLPALTGAVARVYSPITATLTWRPRSRSKRM